MSGPRAMTDLKVLLNSYHSGANAWFALAEARGLFAAQGVEVRFTPGNGAFRAPMLMVEGKFDLAFGDMSSLTRLVAEGGESGPAAVYAVHHRSPSAIAVPADGPVRTPADLRGRRMLTHLSDVAYRSFPAYAEAAGLSLGEVAIALSDDPMAGMLQTMLAGGADGVFGYVSSQKAVLRQIDPALAGRLRFLPFPDIVPDLYGSAMIASREAMEVKGAALRAFLAGLNAALLQAVADPEAAVEAVLERNPALDRAVEQARWRETIADEMSHPEIETLGFGAMDAARLGRAAAGLARTAPLSRNPPASDLFDGAFLPPMADRMAVTQAILTSPRPVP
jgi:NitT/TauT family transport system substrate-binding protein